MAAGKFDKVGDGWSAWVDVEGGSWSRLCVVTILLFLLALPVVSSILAGSLALFLLGVPGSQDGRTRGVAGETFSLPDTSALSIFLLDGVVLASAWKQCTL